MDEFQIRCIACQAGMAVFIERIWDDRYGHPGVYSIFRCTNCDQMATMPPLLNSDLPNLYQKYYARRNTNYENLVFEAAEAGKRFANLNRWINGTNNQGHYCARVGQRVLDVGAGSCLSLLELKSRGIEAWGVETDPDVDAIAKRFSLNVHIGSMDDNPFPTVTFDLITLSQVIEHVPDPSALLRTLSKRLSASGSLILSFPNSASLQRRLSGVRWINWHVPYHQHHFNKDSIEKLANNIGLSVSLINTVTPNLWSKLQWNVRKTVTRPGELSMNWAVESGDPYNKRISPTLWSKVKAKLGGATLNAIITVVNRTVDQFGLGDCLIVVLKKNHNSKDINTA